MDSQTWDKLLAFKQSLHEGNINNTTGSPDLTNENIVCQEYLKVIRIPYESRLDRPIIFAHLAQTLDGKIACLNGHSKWIGNKDNLVHAHRMRALCDAVMVGKKTWITDHPQLNVRHVKGNDPKRIIIEGHSVQNNDYPRVYVLENDTRDQDTWEQPTDLMTSLFTKGIRSIFLEGGGKTISYFMQNNLIDYLHLHISPILIGSGKDSITLPVVESLDKAVYFEDYRYIPIGDHILFTGKLSHQ